MSAITIKHLTKSTKGNDLLIDSDNRAYLRSKVNSNGTINFRCQQYLTKVACKTSLTTNNNKTEITRDPSIPHTCEVLLEVDIQMILSHQIIKNRVQSESSTVGRIFKEESRT